MYLYLFVFIFSPGRTTWKKPIIYIRKPKWLHSPHWKTFCLQHTMTRRRITAARDISRHPSAAGAPDDHPDTRGERHSAFRFVRSYEYCAQYLLSILDRHLLIYFAFITNSVLGSLLLEVVGPSVWISELNKYCYIAL